MFNFDLMMSNFADTYRLDQIKDCDAFLAIVNRNYKESQELMDDLENALSFGKLVIRLNLEQVVIQDMNGYINDEKLVDFYFNKEKDKRFIDGEGELFCELVYFFEKNLPKTVIQKDKKTDLLIITPNKLKSKVTNLQNKFKIKYSHPSAVLNPNFQLVLDSRIIFAIFTDETCSNEKIVQEINYAQLIGSQIFILEDTTISNSNSKLDVISEKIPQKNRFKGLQSLKDSVFLNTLTNEINKVITKTNFEKDLLDKFIQVGFEAFIV